jgi:ERF superfamily
MSATPTGDLEATPTDAAELIQRIARLEDAVRTLAAERTDDAPPELTPEFVAKLAKAALAIGNIPKKGKNREHNYDFARDADIVAAVRKELFGAGLIFIPRMRRVTRLPIQSRNNNPGVHATVMFSFTITDGTTSLHVPRWEGEGSDFPGEKAVYKASTGAKKQFLVTALLLDTGDAGDPEHDGGGETGAAQAAQPRGRQQKRDDGPVKISPSMRNKLYATAGEHGLSNRRLHVLLSFLTRADANGEPLAGGGKELTSINDIPRAWFDVLLEGVVTHGKLEGARRGAAWAAIDEWAEREGVAAVDDEGPDGRPAPKAGKDEAPTTGAGPEPT